MAIWLFSCVGKPEFLLIKVHRVKAADKEDGRFLDSILWGV